MAKKIEGLRVTTPAAHEEKGKTSEDGWAPGYGKYGECEAETVTRVAATLAKDGSTLLVVVNGNDEDAPDFGFLKMPDGGLGIRSAAVKALIRMKLSSFTTLEEVEEWHHPIVGLLEAHLGHAPEAGEWHVVYWAE